MMCGLFFFVMTTEQCYCRDNDGKTSIIFFVMTTEQCYCRDNDGKTSIFRVT